MNRPNCTPNSLLHRRKWAVCGLSMGVLGLDSALQGRGTGSGVGNLSPECLLVRTSTLVWRSFWEVTCHSQQAGRNFLTLVYRSSPSSQVWAPCLPAELSSLSWWWPMGISMKKLIQNKRKLNRERDSKASTDWNCFVPEGFMEGLLEMTSLLRFLQGGFSGKA